MTTRTLLVAIVALGMMLTGCSDRGATATATAELELTIFDFELQQETAQPYDVVVNFENVQQDFTREGDTFVGSVELDKYALNHLHAGVFDIRDTGEILVVLDRVAPIRSTLAVLGGTTLDCVVETGGGKAYAFYVESEFVSSVANGGAIYKPAIRNETEGCLPLFDIDSREVRFVPAKGLELSQVYLETGYLTPTMPGCCIYYPNTLFLQPDGSFAADLPIRIGEIGIVQVRLQGRCGEEQTGFNCPGDLQPEVGEEVGTLFVDTTQYKVVGVETTVGFAGIATVTSTPVHVGSRALSPNI